jgi:hypothetical protein
MEDDEGSKGWKLESSMELGKMNPSCRGWAGGAGGVAARTMEQVVER